MLIKEKQSNRVGFIYSILLRVGPRNCAIIAFAAMLLAILIFKTRG